ADKNIIYFLQNTDLFRSDISQDTDCQSRTGERMSSQQTGIYPHRGTYSSHFVLEQHTKRFYHFEFHKIRQTAYVVMAFYGGRRAVYRNRFDDIRVNRSLAEPFYILYF